MKMPATFGLATGQYDGPVMVRNDARRYGSGLWTLRVKRGEFSGSVTGEGGIAEKRLRRHWLLLTCCAETSPNVASRFDNFLNVSPKGAS